MRTLGLTFIEKTTLTVKLEGKIVGHIKQVAGGYQYFPKGNKYGGEIFASKIDCMNSL